MMSASEVLMSMIAFTLVAMIVLLLYFLYNKTVYIKISYDDGFKTEIARGYKNKREASEMIKDLNTFGIGVLAHLKKIKDKDSSKVYFIRNLLMKYQQDALSENPPRGSDTSFVRGKGAVLKLCLRDHRTKKLHSLDLLKYVYLHEITHIGSNTQQHTAEFWENFRWLLMTVDNAGIYHPKDYDKTPEWYCNMLLDSTPYVSTRYE